MSATESKTTTATKRAEADTVSFVIQDGIAWVKFDRPEKRNAMSPSLNRRMLAVLDQLEFEAQSKLARIHKEFDARPSSRPNRWSWRWSQP